MNKYNITLEEQDKKNLAAFLGRVDLKGVEVPAYVKLINLIESAEQIEEDKKVGD